MLDTYYIAIFTIDSQTQKQSDDDFDPSRFAYQPRKSKLKPKRRSAPGWEVPIDRDDVLRLL